MLHFYRQGFFDDRLRSVVDHVRSWLYSSKAEQRRQATKKEQAKTKPRQAERDDVTPALRIVG